MSFSVQDEDAILHRLRHFLPSQAPLKDFIHHNTLHAFQDMEFHEGCEHASHVFGYKTRLSIEEYRALYAKGAIRQRVIERLITERYGSSSLASWKEKMLHGSYVLGLSKRTGTLRHHWKTAYHFDLDSRVHPKLFRLLNSYLDQGIAEWHFPHRGQGLLESIRSLETSSFTSFFRTELARTLLMDTQCTWSTLLRWLVGDERLFAQYIYDQQFAHPGWSGMVSQLEERPQSLLDPRPITLHEFIHLELLFEIDSVHHHFKTSFIPLAQKATIAPLDIFSPSSTTEADEVFRLWQDAFEWTYYDEVLNALKSKPIATKRAEPAFQVLCCIDDRSESFRRYLEQYNLNCETFGTPGHFGIDSFYQPDGGKFFTQICPAPIRPKHVIRETDSKRTRQKDNHLSRKTHGLIIGTLLSQTLGFVSALKLVRNILMPAPTPVASESNAHMDPHSTLQIEFAGTKNPDEKIQVGYTLDEMTDRVAQVLNSIGLTKRWAPIVYVIGHGSSSVNNTHYAGYDCGACSGRPGSVNARAFAMMANDPRVRKRLSERGIRIHPGTQFVGALHDTSRDEITFFDTDKLSVFNEVLHSDYQSTFTLALEKNAKERARRFELVNVQQPDKVVHKEVKLRTVSLFEPRPELNHATNALCIIGRRSLTAHLFLDRKAFLNSYDYNQDPDGTWLSGILSAAAPVCGGINLEYFFSRTDNHKLGAGTKLPHNVMGLIGVANGIEGDLRTGLPKQMIEVHDPLRLLMVVEQKPHIVMDAISQSLSLYNWFKLGWIHLVVIDPETSALLRFEKDELKPYEPTPCHIDAVRDPAQVLIQERDNLPIFYVR